MSPNGDNLPQCAPMLQNRHMAIRIIMSGLVSLGLALAFDPAALASLGGDAASIETDAAALRGTPITRPSPAYTVREIAGESSMDVQEFTNNRGVVFAVSWSAPVIPDLRLLLGSYFGRYTDALARLRQAGIHRTVRIDSPELVVESSGHLRAYRGLAYLPSEVPAGVTTTELQ
jgi:hypothetical protein